MLTLQVLQEAHSDLQSTKVSRETDQKVKTLSWQVSKIIQSLKIPRDQGKLQEDQQLVVEVLGNQEEDIRNSQAALITRIL